MRFVLLLIGLVLFGCAGPADAPGAAAPPPLTREILDRSLELGRSFLLNNQTAEGSFRYHFNFLSGEDIDGDSPARQAGALWSVALIHQDRPSPETREAVLRGLQLFDGYAERTADDGTYIVYPGTTVGRTGAVALVTLSWIELWRVHGDEVRSDEVLRRIERHVEFLLSQRREDGRFHPYYDPADGRPVAGDGSPYADGETLLALVKAARYAGREDLWDRVLESADAMYHAYVTEARATEPDSDLTKGFYQWGSLAFFELFDSGLPETAVYAERTIELAHWMIDVHRTLERTLNTGYAYEGLIPAWELARRTGDTASQEKIGRVIEQGLAKLTSWQVGGPIPNEFLRGYPLEAPGVVGGVLRAEESTRLRIDVTQHQMHAVILARRYVYGD